MEGYIIACSYQFHLDPSMLQQHKIEPLATPSSLFVTLEPVESGEIAEITQTSVTNWKQLVGTSVSVELSPFWDQNS